MVLEIILAVASAVGLIWCWRVVVARDVDLLPKSRSEALRKLLRK